MTRQLPGPRRQHLSFTYPVIACALFSIAGLSAKAEEFALHHDVTACETDKRYKVGGAAIGECLLVISGYVDREIEDILSGETGRFCTPRDRKDLTDAQLEWKSYRDRHCGLVQRSQGNTASYISSAACRLLLGRQRLEGLRLLTDYSRPLCPEFVLVEEASRYGEQATDAAVQIPESGLEWSVVGRPGDNRLDIRNTASKSIVASMDLSRCNFCSGREDNCERDGIFVMSSKETPTRPAVFHVCHVGAHSQRLQLIDPASSGSEILLDVTGTYYVDWDVSDGRLHFFPDGDKPRTAYWPRK